MMTNNAITQFYTISTLFLLRCLRLTQSSCSPADSRRSNCYLFTSLAANTFFVGNHKAPLTSRAVKGITCTPFQTG